jgi:hypothetical protein
MPSGKKGERSRTAERDTCVGKKKRYQGSDPHTNYMDFVDDPCMFHFTQGQRARMNNLWRFRN